MGSIRGTTKSGNAKLSPSFEEKGDFESVDTFFKKVDQEPCIPLVKRK